MPPENDRVIPRPRRQDLQNPAREVGIRDMWAQAAQAPRFDNQWIIQQDNAVNVAAQDLAGPMPELDIFVDEPPGLAALKKKVATKPASNQMGDIYGVKLHPKAAKAVSSHPGEIIKGIELEIENFPVPMEEAEATGFNFVADGSLRNNGIEAVSNPNNTKGLLVTTEALWEKYNIKENNFSDRTSIHVHANVWDFSSEAFKSLTLYYQVFEELLFDFVGHDRANNIFCVPWYEAGITALNHRRMIEKPRDWQKYTALNLHPVVSQGTVEFRHMHGHANLEMLTAWLAIIDDLMLTAKKSDYNVVVNTINDLNTNSQYYNFLTTTFPSSWKFLMSDRWEHKLSRGVVEAKYSMV